jgi:para-nitrobenzyl esterase
VARPESAARPRRRGGRRDGAVTGQAAGIGPLTLPDDRFPTLDGANVASEIHVSGMTQHPLVRLKDGAVRDKAESGIQAFLGIPYAAPPFGANRMQPPQPVRAWDGERDGTAYGPTAPKGNYPPQFAPLFPEVVIPGEGCLNLNVWTPDTNATGLPVLVWIHGGSFTNGSGSIGEYNGAAFARDGVVCVTINYRLAAEGFLFLDDGIANLGLLDQLAALRWVQGNISTFGGDPARVTVAGESSGAMGVTTLLSMPLAEGLFTQAIAQSGAAATRSPGTKPAW